MRSFSSFSNPLITARTMMRAITPTATPRIEITVMMEMNVCFRLARRYFRPMKYSTGSSTLVHRLANPLAFERRCIRSRFVALLHHTQRYASVARPEEILVPRMRRLVPLFPRAQLLLEPSSLLQGVVQLGERVGDFPSPHDQLESVHDVRAGIVCAGKGRHPDGVLPD